MSRTRQRVYLVALTRFLIFLQDHALLRVITHRRYLGWIYLSKSGHDFARRGRLAPATVLKAWSRWTEVKYFFSGYSHVLHLICSSKLEDATTIAHEQAQASPAVG